MKLVREWVDSQYHSKRARFLDDHRHDENRYELAHEKAVRMSQDFELLAWMLSHPESQQRSPIRLGIASGLNKEGLIPESVLYYLGIDVNNVGTVMPTQRNGNEKPRIFTWENSSYLTRGSLANNVGLPCPGPKVVRDNIKRNLDERVITRASVMQTPGNTGQEAIDEIIYTMDILRKVVTQYEINFSCPNVEHGATGVEESLEFRRELFWKIGEKELTHPIYCKEAPNLTQDYVDKIVSISNAPEYPYIKGHSLTNTDRRQILVTTLQGETVYGAGISGPDLRDKAVEVLGYFVRAIKEQRADLELNALGGINSGSEAANRVRLGEGLVKEIQIYSGFVERGTILGREIHEALTKCYGLREAA